MVLVAVAWGLQSTEASVVVAIKHTGFIALTACGILVFQPGLNPALQDRFLTDG